MICCKRRPTAQYFDWKCYIFFFAGFGDAVNNSECWNPVIKYVEDQFDQFLDAESKVERIPMRDSRVHVCLYFIAPTGHCLKPLDIEFMKRIHEKVIFNHLFKLVLCKCTSKKASILLQNREIKFERGIPI